MKRLLWIFTLAGILCGVSHAQITINQMPDVKQAHDIKLVTPGGYWKSSGTAPNSPEALEAAILFGCYASVCHVSQTLDHVWVVAEENPRHPVSPDSVPYAQLRKSGALLQTLDDYILGSYLRMAFPAHRGNAIPADRLARHPSAKTPTKLLLNFRNCPSVREQRELTSLLGKTLSDGRLKNQVEFCSDDLSLCLALSDRFPDIPNTYMKGDLSPRELRRKGFTGGCAYDRNTLTEHPKWMQEAAALGMPVSVSGIRNADDVHEMVSARVDRIITDDLALADAWARRKSVVKLMSFNIRMSGMPDLDGDNAWEKRKEAVVRMLKSESPDVFGVQEMLPDQQKYLRERLTAYEMVGVGRDDGLEEGECMGVFYKKDRFALEESGTFWLSETPNAPSLGWDAACKRTVTYVHLKERKSGKGFFYFNTHLDHVGKIARQESVNLIADKIRAIVPDTHSVIILGGDMNSPLHDNIFAPWTGGNATTARQDDADQIQNLQKKRAEAATPMEKPSRTSRSLLRSCRNTAWQRDNAYTYTGFGKDKPSQIDHILATPATESLIFRTVKNNFGAPYVSDHYPVTLTFTLE